MWFRPQTAAKPQVTQYTKSTDYFVCLSSCQYVRVLNMGVSRYQGADTGVCKLGGFSPVLVRLRILRWEFIKENKKVRKQENKNSTKKAIKKTRKKRTRPRKRPRKKKKLSFFLDHFLG